MEIVQALQRPHGAIILHELSNFIVLEIAERRKQTNAFLVNKVGRPGNKCQSYMTRSSLHSFRAGISRILLLLRSLQKKLDNCVFIRRSLIRSSYSVLSPGRNAHMDEGMCSMLARSNRSSSSAAVPFRFGNWVTSLASETILERGEKVRRKVEKARGGGGRGKEVTAVTTTYGLMEKLLLLPNEVKAKAHFWQLPRLGHCASFRGHFLQPLRFVLRPAGSPGLHDSWQQQRRQPRALVTENETRKTKKKFCFEERLLSLLLECENNLATSFPSFVILPIFFGALAFSRKTSLEKAKAPLNLLAVRRLWPLKSASLVCCRPRQIPR